MILLTPLNTESESTNGMGKVSKSFGQNIDHLR